jgi:hypothetical protein
MLYEAASGHGRVILIEETGEERAARIQQAYYHSLLSYQLTPGQLKTLRQARRAACQPVLC